LIAKEDNKITRPQSGTAMIPPIDNESNGTPKIAPIEFEKKPLPGDYGSGILSNSDENG
jgi:hypothetical protein